MLEILFKAASSLDPAERGAFLDVACGDDAALRRELEELLEADALAEAEQYLEGVAAGHVGPIPQLDDAELDAGELVGPYRIVRRIGRGGMGEVYLAQRDEPYRMRVALKVVRRGVATRELLRRFAMERQILASLDHPNISRLLDGGVSDDGRSYLAMEYVEGVPIVDYCETNGLSIEARLELFATVCRAVEHAHRNLVLHRDLKPTNILVTGDGTPKLLDFGIAKLLNPELAPIDAPATGTDVRLMTPEYASPEQLRARPLTTVSDVYSLGVLLYELLTGARPYRLTDRSVAEIVRAVCDEDPAPPSVGVRSGDEPDGDDRRRLRLSRRLQGDLDAIVMCAMRKEPDRRYGSAEELAADIGRHLAGEPVQSVRGSRAYRLGKLLRRHRVAASALTALVAVVAASVVLAVNHARTIALERDRVQTAAGRNEALVRFMISIFESADPTHARSDTIAVGSILEAGIERAERELASQPTAQAAIYDAIGRAFANLGRLDRAIELHERSLALQRRLHGNGLEVAATMLELGELLEAQGSYARAEALFTELLGLLRRIHGGEHASQLRPLFHLATIRHRDRPGGEAMMREWSELLARLPETDDSLVAEALIDMASLTQVLGDVARAEAQIRRALEIQSRLYGGDDPRVATTISVLASIVLDRESAAEAERLVRSAIDRQRRLYPNGSAELVNSLRLLGRALTAQSRIAEAERVHREELGMCERVYGVSHKSTATAAVLLARAVAARGDLGAAEQLLRRTVEIFRADFGPDYIITLQYTVELGELLIERGRRDEARELLMSARSTLAATRPAGDRTLARADSVLAGMSP